MVLHAGRACSTFNRRYLLHPPRLEAQLGGETIAGVTAIVQNATPYTYFGDRPVEMGEGATLDSGDLAGVVLDRARPIDIPTIIGRALSRHLRVSRHRHVHSFSGVHGPARPLARRAAAAAPGRRRLHRRGRRGRVRRARRTGSRSSPELDRLPMRRSRSPWRSSRARRGGADRACRRSWPRTRCPGAPSCPVFPADNPWNQRVDRLPVAEELGRHDRQHRAERPGPPGLRVGPLRRRAERDPVRGRLVAAPGGCRSASSTPPSPTAGRTRCRAGVPIEGGYGSSGDRHVIVVDRDTCTDYELFAAYPHDGGSAGRPARARSSTCAPTTCGRPAGPRPTPPGCRSCPAWPATTRSPPASIDHALRFTAPCTAPRYVYPARHEASTCHGREPAADGPARPPEGERQHLGAALPGAGRRAGAEALRDDPGRQRLAVVHLGRARTGAGTTTRCTCSTG